MARFKVHCIGRDTVLELFAMLDMKSYLSPWNILAALGIYLWPDMVLAPLANIVIP